MTRLVFNSQHMDYEKRIILREKDIIMKKGIL